MKEPHILLTGGGGFIGSNLTRALLRNMKVTCIDNLDHCYSRYKKERNISEFLSNHNYSFIEGDISDSSLLNKIEEVDIIIHLAAKAGVRPSIEQSLTYTDINVRGTQVLLEFAKNRKIGKFIFASSSSVYGINESVPWKESEILMPISPYAATKLSGEMLGHVYSRLYNIRFIALRLFTVYGPGQRPDLAIHKFFDLISKGKPIQVYGNGSTRRDYTFIDDVIDGILACIKFEGSLFEVFNLGNNQTVALLELINSIEQVVKKKAIIQFYPEQLGDVPETFADISKAAASLGYTPKVKIEDGLNRFYNWFLRDQSNRFH